MSPYASEHDNSSGIISATDFTTMPENNTKKMNKKMGKTMTSSSSQLKKTKKSRAQKHKKQSVEFKKHFIALYRRSNFTEWLYSRGIGMNEDFGDEGFCVGPADAESEGFNEEEHKEGETSENNSDAENTPTDMEVVEEEKTTPTTTTKKQQKGVTIIEESEADSEEVKFRDALRKKLNYKGTDGKFVAELKTNPTLKKQFDEANTTKKKEKKEKIAKIDFLPNLREETNSSSGSSSEADASDKERENSATKVLVNKVSKSNKNENVVIQNVPKQTEDVKMAVKEVKANKEAENVGKLAAEKLKLNLAQNTQNNSTAKKVKNVTWNKDFADLEIYDYNGLVSNVQLL